MNLSLAWDKEFLEPVLFIGLTLFGLLGYWLTITSEYLKQRFIKKFGEEESKVKWIMFWRYAGFFYFALVPSVVIFTVLPYSPAYYGLSFINIPESLLWSLGLGLVILLMQNRSARKPDNTVQYPQIRINEWTRGLIIKNSFGWIIYLLAYEFIYRGILLFGLIGPFGVWPAILVNTIIYSLAHIPKGNREAVAAIPFGIILCILTIKTGTIWISVLVHIVLALSNDYFALAASSTMKVKRK